MRKVRSIGVVISLLLIIILLLVFMDPWSMLRSESKKINLQHPSNVDRVILTSVDDSTLLVRQDSTWFLFGEEPANQVAVDNLLFAASRIQISSIQPTRPDADLQYSRKVRYFEGKKCVLEYDFFKDGPNYLIRPPATGKAYAITVSGYSELNLEKVFSSAVNHYRKHILIDLLPSEIAEVEITGGNQKRFRFLQDMEGNITCQLPEEDSLVPAELLNEISIRLLFSYFSPVLYVRTCPLKEREGEMLAQLRIRTREGMMHILRVYPYYEEDHEEADMFLALVRYNNKPELLVVYYIYLDVLMRELSHYLILHE